MMRVSRLSKAHDWNFGRGKADYLKASEAIHQNIRTRIKSFKRDWYLDVDANIDWLTILSKRGIRVETIRQQVERVVQKTEGVARVDKIETDFDRAQRSLTITVYVVDVYNSQLVIEDVQI